MRKSQRLKHKRTKTNKFSPAPKNNRVWRLPCTVILAISAAPNYLRGTTMSLDNAKVFLFDMNYNEELRTKHFEALPSGRQTREERMAQCSGCKRKRI